jgi:excisionase family DNA binding protein
MELNEKNTINLILLELQEIKQQMMFKKQIWTIDDFCNYTGISKEYAYHLTSTGKVKFYRPFGKTIFFDANEVIETLKKNPNTEARQMESKANKYLLNNL